MQISIKLGEEIRRVRNHLKNYDQKEFAKLIGISNVHLSNLENGKKLPSQELLVKVFATINQEVPPEITEMLKEARTESKLGNTEPSYGDIVYLLQEEGLYSATKLKDLLKLEPDNLKLIYGLLTLLKGEGKIEEARQHLLQSLIHIKRDEIKRWLEAYYFLLEGNYKMAIELMQKALEEFDKQFPEPDSEGKKRKAGLLFELSSMFYEYGYYSFNYESNPSLAIENFINTLNCYHKISELHSEPYYEMNLANVFWWLAFLGENSRENWEAYIEKAENILLLNHEHKMRRFIQTKTSRGLYSEPYIIQLISGMAEAYAKLAKLEQAKKLPENEKKQQLNYLLKKGELLLAQHSPINIQPERREYYSFYFTYACFYSIRAEISESFGADYQNYLDLCGKGLQEAAFGDSKSKLHQFKKDLNDALQNELSFFANKRADDLKYIN
jgi:transcriptional regulator with XRE-family HTH domain